MTRRPTRVEVSGKNDADMLRLTLAPERPQNFSRLELAAQAHKNAVEERKRIQAEVEELRRELEAAQTGLNEAGDTVNETARQLTAAALGKPE